MGRNILVIVNDFYPETTSAAQLFYELCIHLRKYSHKVIVLTTVPKTKQYIQQYSIWKLLKLFYIQTIEGVLVYRIIPLIYFLLLFRKILYVLGRQYRRKDKKLRCDVFVGINSYTKEKLLQFYITFQQVLQASLFLVLGLLIRIIHDFKPNIIIVYSPPLFYGFSGLILSKLFGSSLILNVQDIHPQALIDLHILKDRCLIKLYSFIEKVIYNTACAIAVHSLGNKRYLVYKKCVSKKKVVTIHNWVDINRIKLLIDKKYILNLRKKLNLEKKFIVLYAGVLGHSQDIKTVLKAAHVLKENPDITFLIVGDGPLKNELIKIAKELQLRNVIFLPYQPMEKYPSLVMSADICLVPLKRSVRTPVVPKKFIDYLVLGKPIIAIVPPKNDVAWYINMFKCGIVVEPGNYNELANAILWLYRNAELRRYYAENARAYSRLFDVYFAVNVYNKLIDICTKE